MHFWKILQYGTRTNKLSGKRYRQFSILEKSHFSLCPGSGPKGSNAKWCLPGQEMEEDSALPHAWGQQELVASKGWGRRCHGQGSSRGARAPGPLREELLLPPNLAHVLENWDSETVSCFWAGIRGFSLHWTYDSLWSDSAFERTVKSPDFQTSKFNRSSVLQSRWLSYKELFILHSYWPLPFL